MLLGVLMLCALPFLCCWHVNWWKEVKTPPRTVYGLWVNCNFCLDCNALALIHYGAQMQQGCSACGQQVTMMSL